MYYQHILVCSGTNLAVDVDAVSVGFVVIVMAGGLKLSYELKDSIEIKI